MSELAPTKPQPTNVVEAMRDEGFITNVKGLLPRDSPTGRQPLQPLPKIKAYDPPPTQEEANQMTMVPGNTAWTLNNDFVESPDPNIARAEQNAADGEGAAAVAELQEASGANHEPAAAFEAAGMPVDTFPRLRDVRASGDGCPDRRDQGRRVAGRADAGGNQRPRQAWARGEAAPQGRHPARRLGVPGGRRATGSDT